MSRLSRRAFFTGTLAAGAAVLTGATGVRASEEINTDKHVGMLYDAIFSLDTTKYVCQFCGTIVDDGKQCPNCGGYRLPYSEVVRMDRERLYCHTKVYGSVICPNCQHSLAAITLGEVL